MPTTDILDVLLRAAAGVAFPAAVAVYLLTRMESSIDKLREEISQLRLAITQAASGTVGNRRE